VPEGFQQWTPASLKEVERSVKSEADASSSHMADRHLADFPQDTLILVRRQADGVVELHETQADVFVVQSGSATLLVGGTMVGGETTAPNERRNGTIRDGIKRKLSVGDIVRIPARTPHQVLLNGSAEITYLVIKVKGY
jgi:mannose-6-phosphate isomerase-like protein (cupin superfamily)